MAETLGQRLTTLRKAAKLTQEEVAEKLGVTQSAVSQWETGLAAPSASLLPALLDLYGTSANQWAEILRLPRIPGDPASTEAL